MDSKVEKPIETYVMRIQPKMNILPKGGREGETSPTPTVDGPIFQDYRGDVFSEVLRPNFHGNFQFHVCHNGFTSPVKSLHHSKRYSAKSNIPETSHTNIYSIYVYINLCI